MRKGKWSTLPMVVLIVALCLSGCVNSADTGKPASPGSTADPGAKPDTKTVSTYTMAVSDNKLTWDGPITQELTKKTGVQLKYDVIVGDIFQKWDLWLAAGDYPDMIRLDSNRLQKYIDASAVIPLEGLIDKYGPNIKKRFGNYLNLLKHSDGHIYSIYSVNQAQEAPANTKPGFIVQNDVLKEAGYPKIKTLDDLYNVIKAYKDKHPQIDGKETIAFGAAMNSWTIKIFFNNPAISAAGFPDHGNFYIEDNGTVHWNPVSEYSKQYHAFLNKLYNEGLMDKEAFSMNDKDLQAKMAQGRVLAGYAPAWFSGAPEQSLQAEGKLDRMYAHLPVYLNAAVKDRSNAMTPANGGTHEWAITNKAKNPEKLIQFIDYLFSDEGQVLTQWGIEGVHYEKKDGKRVQKDEWLKKKQSDPDAQYKEGFRSEITGGTSNWFSTGDGSKLGDGDYATPVTKDIVRMEYANTTKDVLGKYNLQTWADLLPPVEKVPSYLWQLPPPADTEFKVLEQKLEDLWRKSTPKIVMAKSAQEFEQQFSSFQSQAKQLGLQKYEDAYTKVWKEFIQSYNASLAK